MTEPRRWLDDPSIPPRMREVLRSAPDVPPLTAELHALGTAMVTGLVSGLPVKAAVASMGAKSAASLFALGQAGRVAVFVSLVGAAGASGYLLIARQPAMPLTLGETRSAVAHAPSALPRLRASVAPTQELPENALGSIAAALPSTAAVQGAHAATVRRQTPDSVQSQQQEVNSARQSSVAVFGELSIADEARLLEQARLALSNDPAQALVLVERHQRLYPSGQLGLERELIAVDALVRLGRRSEAEQRAAPHLQPSSDNLYARRLRQLLGAK